MLKGMAVATLTMIWTSVAYAQSSSDFAGGAFQRQLLEEAARSGLLARELQAENGQLKLLSSSTGQPLLAPRDQSLNKALQRDQDTADSIRNMTIRTRSSFTNDSFIFGETQYVLEAPVFNERTVNGGHQLGRYKDNAKDLCDQLPGLCVEAGFTVGEDFENYEDICVEKGFSSIISAGDFKRLWRKRTDPATDNKQQDYIEKISNFDRSCYSKTESLPDPIRHISQMVGVFTVQEKKSTALLCAGLILSGQKVLTTRHCFFSKKSVRGSRLRLKQITFHILSHDGEREERFTVATEQFESFPERAFSDPDDHIIVTVAGLPDPPVAPVFAAPVHDAKLYVLGPQSEVYNAERLSGGNQPMTSMRWDSGLLCRVLKVGGNKDEGCIFHGCNSKGGFSGTPMFQTDSTGRLVVVGIHLGAVGRTNSCDGALIDTAGGESSRKEKMAGFNTGYTVPTIQ